MISTLKRRGLGHDETPLKIAKYPNPTYNVISFYYALLHFRPPTKNLKKYSYLDFYLPAENWHDILCYYWQFVLEEKLKPLFIFRKFTTTSNSLSDDKKEPLRIPESIFKL
jgi:hypothetical protein